MNEPGPTPLETLNGSGEIVVTRLDGTTESVRLRQITLGECEKLLLVQGDEIALACLYTGKERAWFEALDPVSQEQVVIEGDRINADFFGRWLSRRLARQERIAPGMMAKVLERAIAPETIEPAPVTPSRSQNSAPPLVRSRV
jgi:hypothetical protein